MYNPQLETFLTVAEAGSFNKAAEKLYISPPAVIKQINLLERDLDLRLFLRTHRGLQLTKAGQSLYQDAKYIIQYCKDSVTRARNAMEEYDPHYPQESRSVCNSRKPPSLLDLSNGACSVMCPSVFRE